MSVAAKNKKMAAKLLEDILNNFISIDSLLDWLSNQYTVDNVNIFVDHYKCNQVEFAAYFLNFLREQSSVILQSSCSVETPCKNTQLRKKKIFNYSSDKSVNEFKSGRSVTSSEKKFDVKSLESFPALSDASNKKNGEKSRCKFLDSTPKECPSSSKDSMKKFRRVQLFPEKPEENFGVQEIDHTSSEFDKSAENRNLAMVSTPKSSGTESVDISDFFSDVVNLDGSSECSPGFRWKRDNNRTEYVTERDRTKQNNSVVKYKSFSGDSASYRGKDSRSSSRALLGDFIMNDMNSTEPRRDKKKIRKRINPTRVNSQLSQFEGSSSFEVSGCALESGSSTTEERQLLRVECANLMERLEMKPLADASRKDPAPVRTFSTPSKTVTPDLRSATFVGELKVLSKIYSSILDEIYCQNVMMELCFVISLLVIQDHTSEDKSENANDETKKDRKFFDSVHNCVYFAVETLWLQRNVVILLNLAALKLLSENKQVQNFNAELKEFLTKAYRERQGKEAIKRQVGDSKGIRQGNFRMGNIRLLKN